MLWTVELSAIARLNSTVTVEAETREDAYQKAFDLDIRTVDIGCEGEAYSLTGDVEVLDIYPDEGEEED